MYVLMTNVTVAELKSKIEYKKFVYEPMGHIANRNIAKHSNH